MRKHEARLLTKRPRTQYAARLCTLYLVRVFHHQHIQLSLKTQLGKPTASCQAGIASNEVCLPRQQGRGHLTSFNVPSSPHLCLCIETFLKQLCFCRYRYREFTAREWVQRVQKQQTCSEPQRWNTEKEQNKDQVDRRPTLDHTQVCAWSSVQAQA